MFRAIKAGEYDFPTPFWDDVEPGAKDMIRCLLVLDPEERYSAEQVGNQGSEFLAIMPVRKKKEKNKIIPLVYSRSSNTDTTFEVKLFSLAVEPMSTRFQ